MPQRKDNTEEKLQSIREKLKEWPSSCDERGDYINILLVGHGSIQIEGGIVQPISDKIAGTIPTFGIPSSSIEGMCGVGIPSKYYHTAKQVYKMKCLGLMDYDTPGFFLNVLDEQFSEFDKKHKTVQPVKLHLSRDNINVTFSDHLRNLLPGIYIINDLFTPLANPYIKILEREYDTFNGLDPQGNDLGKPMMKTFWEKGDISAQIFNDIKGSENYIKDSENNYKTVFRSINLQGPPYMTEQVTGDLSIDCNSIIESIYKLYGKIPVLFNHLCKASGHIIERTYDQVIGNPSLTYPIGFQEKSYTIPDPFLVEAHSRLKKMTHSETKAREDHQKSIDEMFPSVKEYIQKKHKDDMVDLTSHISALSTGRGGGSKKRKKSKRKSKKKKRKKSRTKRKSKKIKRRMKSKHKVKR